MFFPELITKIGPHDRVLEIGPGGLPHQRSDVFLELRFEDQDIGKRQRGGADKPAYTKPVVYYDGGTFPFKNNEFDYVICSHVLEHVDDVEGFEWLSPFRVEQSKTLNDLTWDTLHIPRFSSIEDKQGVLSKLKRFISGKQN